MPRSAGRRSTRCRSSVRSTANTKGSSFGRGSRRIVSRPHPSSSGPVIHGRIQFSHNYNTVRFRPPPQILHASSAIKFCSL